MQKYILLLFVFSVSSECAMVYFLPAGSFFYSSLQSDPTLKRENEDALLLPDAGLQPVNFTPDAVGTDDEGNQGTAHDGGPPKIESKQISVGGLIGSIPFLPIEINVPQVISAITSTLRYIFQNIGQRIPFINTYFVPQPGGMMVVSTIPMTKQNSPMVIFVSNSSSDSSKVSR